MRFENLFDRLPRLGVASVACFVFEKCLKFLTPTHPPRHTTNLTECSKTQKICFFTWFNLLDPLLYYIWEGTYSTEFSEKSKFQSCAHFKGPLFDLWCGFLKKNQGERSEVIVHLAKCQGSRWDRIIHFIHVFVLRFYLMFADKHCGCD